MCCLVAKHNNIYLNHLGRVIDEIPDAISPLDAIYTHNLDRSRYIGHANQRYWNGLTLW